MPSTRTILWALQVGCASGMWLALRVLPVVAQAVHITDGGREGQGMVVRDARGQCVVVVPYHVVEQVNPLQVTLGAGQKRAASIFQAFGKNDLALLSLGPGETVTCSPFPATTGIQAALDQPRVSGVVLRRDDLGQLHRFDVLVETSDRSKLQLVPTRPSDRFTEGFSGSLFFFADNRFGGIVDSVSLQSNNAVALRADFVAGVLGSSLTTDGGDAGAIASRDLGPLHVAVMSLTPIKVSGPDGSSVSAIRASFTFSNRDAQKPILVAVNGNPSGTENTGGFRPPPGLALGASARARLADELGVSWRLRTSDVMGVPVVSVGRRTPDDVADASEIAAFLRMQDELGTNERTDRPRGDTRPDPNGAIFRQFPAYRFVFGSAVAIQPGEKLSVVMTFTADVPGGETRALPTYARLAGEIIVGTAAGTSRVTYAVQNLNIDRVSVSGP